MSALDYDSGPRTTGGGTSAVRASSSTVGPGGSQQIARSGAAIVVWGLTALSPFSAVSSERLSPSFAIDRSEVGQALSPKQGVKLLPSQFLAPYFEIESYKSLDDGWDGIGSIRPRPGVIDDAQAFLSELPRNVSGPEPTVGADGSVGWFWQTPTVYASVAFLGGRRIAYWAQLENGGTPVKGTLSFDGHSIPNDFLELVRLA